MIKDIAKSLSRRSFTVKMIYLYLIMLPITASYFHIIKGVEKIQLSDLVFFVILLSWIFDRIKAGNILKVSHNAVLKFIMGVFLIIILSSSFNSVNLFHSAVDWAGIVYLVILFTIVVSVIDTREAFIGLLAAYSAGAVIAALIGLGALLLYSITGNLSHNTLLILHKYQASLLVIPRIRVFFHTPNMFASFEHVGLIALLSLFFLTEQKSSLLAKSVKLMLIFAVAASVFLTGSQTLAGFVVTLSAISFLFNGKVISAVRYILFPIMIAMLIFAVCATIWMIFPVTINTDTQTKDLDIRVNYAYSYHIIPSMYALSMLKKHPFIGVGIGTFADQYPAYINMDIEKITAAKQGESPGGGLDPHNTYSGALAEWGILGFIAMLSIFVYMFRALSSAPANTKDDFALGSVRKVLLAGFIGLLLSALFIDSMMLRHFWLFMAFIIIFDKIRRRESAAGGSA